MFGKKFKSQFFIIASALFILIFSLNFVYFGYLNLKSEYMLNKLNIKLIENYLDESNFLLVNNKISEFFNFSNFFVNVSKKRNLDLKIIFLNFSISQNEINYSVYLFSEKNLNINISSDISFSYFELQSKNFYSGKLNYFLNKTIFLIFPNYNFEIFCKNKCMFLVVEKTYDNNRIVKSLFLEN